MKRTAFAIVFLLVAFLITPPAPASAVVTHRLIVATSGGDFTSVSAALATITPTANDPYVIEIAAGVYSDNITMKSYVSLRGAGREVTTIQAANTSVAVITLPSSPAPRTNITLSGLTLKGGSIGINNQSGVAVVIRDNRITGNSSGGILTQSSSPFIFNNNITANGSYGIASTGATSAAMTAGNLVTGHPSFGILDSGATTIIGNTVTGNGTASSGSGVYLSNAATAESNVITGNLFDGITVTAVPMIRGNRITGNLKDLNVAAGNPTVTHNTLDITSGTITRWRYNVKSDGTPIGP